MSLGIGIAVENPSGRGFLPSQSLQRIDLDDPIAAYQHRDNNVDWGRMTLGLMNMGALQALPRRPLETLTITVENHVIAFDVSQRTWPDEALVTPEAAQRHSAGPSNGCPSRGTPGRSDSICASWARIWATSFRDRALEAGDGKLEAELDVAGDHPAAQ